MDISPEWWIRARRDEKFLRRYVFEKFERDYYPRTIKHGRSVIDLDKSDKGIKRKLLTRLKKEILVMSFYPRMKF